MPRVKAVTHDRTGSGLTTPAVLEPAPPRQKILLVDDHPILRSGLAGYLNQQADLVVSGEAGSVAEALTLAAGVPPDLIVTDLSLPGRGGLELIKDVRALYPEMPVLVISMHDEFSHAERALRAGARGYLMKDTSAEKVLSAIRQVLRGQVYLSERMSGRIFDSFAGRNVKSSPVDLLTDREFEIFQLIGQGKSTQEIADQFHLSIKTIDVHRSRLKAKLGIANPMELVRHAVRWLQAQNGTCS